MVYTSYDKFWRYEFYNNAPAKGRVQVRKLNQLKLRVNGTYRKDEKVTTGFEPSNDEGVLNKVHLDKNYSK